MSFATSDITISGQRLEQMVGLPVTAHDNTPRAICIRDEARRTSQNMITRQHFEVSSVSIILFSLVARLSWSCTSVPQNGYGKLKHSSQLTSKETCGDTDHSTTCTRQKPALGNIQHAITHLGAHYKLATAALLIRFRDERHCPPQSQ